MNIIKISKKYFNCFKAKDIVELEKMFARNIVLQDWEIYKKGLKKVLAQNIKIFEDLGKFDLKIINLSVFKNKVFAEIEIKVKKEKIKVLDILEFNDDKKIKSIKAFKG